VIQVTNLWSAYCEFTRSKDLILNVCWHEDRMRTKSPWKWAFVRVLYGSVP
jgi:hypothetical protein